LWAYTQAMNATFSALAEPNRLQIVELLRHRPLPVGGIVERLGMRQPQVSKHLRVLSEAGLVQVRPVAQQRIYGLRAEGLKELDDWLKPYREMWSDRFERMDAVLRELTSEEKKSKGETE
jgi:DNA-binding transcriptional ArsR family regulator